MRIIRSVRRNERRAGLAMLYAVVGAFSAATLVAFLLSMSIASDKVSKVKHFGGRAKYLAEGAVDAGKREVLVAVASWREPPNTGTVSIDGQNVVWNVAPTGSDAIRTDPSGIQTIVNNYQITAQAESQFNRSVSRRLVNSEATPVFQFAVFYNNDLEINPGPDMVLGGRVHSNQDIFLNCGGTLSVNTNYLRARGDIFRQRKDNTNSQGTVMVRKWVANPFDSSEPEEYRIMESNQQLLDEGVPTFFVGTGGYDSNFVYGYDSNGDGDYDEPGDYLPWAAGAQEYWKQPDGYSNGEGTTVMTKEHDVQMAVPPPLSSIAAFEEVYGGDYAWNGIEFEKTDPPGTGTHNRGAYHELADLSIIGVPGSLHGWKAYDRGGGDITNDILATNAVTLGEIYDARQAGGANGTDDKVQVIEVDIAKLNASGKFPQNGLIYSTHYGLGEGTDAKGIRLNNGAELHDKLTVVSEGTLFIHGDYNTVNKTGASVIADAVNLLSNSWDDSKTRGGPLPTASETTYNVAMVTGNQDTVGSTYNGGLENLPRFHERWSSIRCNLSGSFVNFWHSKYANAPWGLSGVYKPPVRNWNYDPAFNSVANLPPFTPMTVKARDIVYY